MDYRVDPKGKIFTTHVTKRNLAVVISIGHLVIHGTVYLLLDNRLKDELNEGEQFIAVTDARIYQVGSEAPIYESAALIINKEQIDWIFPTGPATPPADSSS